MKNRGTIAVTNSSSDKSGKGNATQQLGHRDKKNLENKNKNGSHIWQETSLHRYKKKIIAARPACARNAEKPKTLLKPLEKMHQKGDKLREGAEWGFEFGWLKRGSLPCAGAMTFKMLGKKRWGPE